MSWRSIRGCRPRREPRSDADSTQSSSRHGDRVLQGLPARCTGSSRLGIASLAMSALAARGLEPEKLLGSPALDVAQVKVAPAVDGQRMNPVKLAGVLAFGKRAKPCHSPVGRENHDELVLGRNAHDQTRDR